MLRKYLEICDEVEREFRRAKRLHGDRIHCGPGCSDCCGQLFQITEVEAAYISRGFRKLDAARQARLREKAEEYLRRRQELRTASGEPESWGALPPAGTRLPCPALEDGLCTIYEYRPLVCRRFGMPIYNPDSGRLSACELNFKDGEEIHDGQLIQIQTSIHGRWKAVQGAYNDAGGYRDPEPITVARALVEDFSGLA